MNWNKRLTEFTWSKSNWTATCWSQNMKTHLSISAIRLALVVSFLKTFSRSIQYICSSSLVVTLNPVKLGRIISVHKVLSFPRRPIPIWFEQPREPHSPPLQGIWLWCVFFSVRGLFISTSNLQLFTYLTNLTYSNSSFSDLSVYFWFWFFSYSKGMSFVTCRVQVFVDVSWKGCE